MITICVTAVLIVALVCATAAKPVDFEQENIKCVYKDVTIAN